MAKFSENEKVTVSARRVPWDEVTIGTVETVSTNPFLKADLYLVRLENGDLIKCLDEDLKAVPNEDVEEPTEEIKSITITEYEFIKKLYNLDIGKRVGEEFADGLETLGLCMHIVAFTTNLVLGLMDELFEEKANND